jgi:hypothetical protein
MSGDAQINSAEAANRLLSALSEQLALAGEQYDLIVIGGSALLALELVARATRDVDVVALANDTGPIEAVPLPAPLVAARNLVARDFGVPEDWLNSEAAPDMLRLGLPEGFFERLTPREYGPALTIRWASRFDLIHFKLHATVDRGGGRHLADLRALKPTPEELIAAGRWTRTHDPSEGFLSVLKEVLAYFEVDDGHLGA